MGSSNFYLLTTLLVVKWDLILFTRACRQWSVCSWPPVSCLTLRNYFYSQSTCASNHGVNVLKNDVMTNGISIMTSWYIDVRLISWTRFKRFEPVERFHHESALCESYIRQGQCQLTEARTTEEQLNCCNLVDSINQLVNDFLDSISHHVSSQ